MIYQIKNGKLTKFLARNGQKFTTQSKKSKRRTLKNEEHNRFRKFYNSSKWHKLSETIRKRNPICRICLKQFKQGKRPLEKVMLGNSVDHIVPIKLKRGWENRTNPENLQVLCGFHHKLKNKRDHKIKSDF